ELEVVAAASATANGPGFVLSFGTLSDDQGGSKLRAPAKTSVVEFKGGKGRSSITWYANNAFGLEGELKLVEDAKAGSAEVLFSPGAFMVGYKRPIVANIIYGDFVGHRYDFHGQELTLDLDTPLSAGIDQEMYEPEEAK